MTQDANGPATISGLGEKKNGIEYRSRVNSSPLAMALCGAETLCSAEGYLPTICVN